LSINQLYEKIHLLNSFLTRFVPCTPMVQVMAIAHKMTQADTFI